MIYSETDSVFVLPHKRTHLAEIRVLDGQISKWGNTNLDFKLYNPIKHGRISDVLYQMPEQYELVLTDLKNYDYYMIITECSPIEKYSHRYYEYHLTLDFVNTIIDK